MNPPKFTVYSETDYSFIWWQTIFFPWSPEVPWWSANRSHNPNLGQTRVCGALGWPLHALIFHFRPGVGWKPLIAWSSLHLLKNQWTEVLLSLQLPQPLDGHRRCRSLPVQCSSSLSTTTTSHIHTKIRYSSPTTQRRWAQSSYAHRHSRILFSPRSTTLHRAHHQNGRSWWSLHVTPPRLVQPVSTTATNDSLFTKTNDYSRCRLHSSLLCCRARFPRYARRCSQTSRMYQINSSPL